MQATSPSAKITIVIDNQPVTVPKGTNVIEAAARLNKEIPHYCYHPKLSVVGNCRMCLVEMGMPPRDPQAAALSEKNSGKAQIQWLPKPVIACATEVATGMHIRTDSAKVKACREGVMEFLLINHPLDCPICDQAGECRLQEFATDYGRGYSRFIEDKQVKPKRTRLGPRVMLDDERCILCSRCIRFCQEIVRDDVLGFIDRGSYSTLTCFPGKELANNYSLNTVDICPVGALTSTDFRFKMRVWFLKQTPSICTESSTGCNTVVWSREGKIYRITPRRNDAVNDTWMPDSGRMLYRQWETADRLTDYTIDGKPVKAAAAVAKAADLLQTSGEETAIVGSGQASVEEQFLLKQLVDATKATAPVDLVSRTDSGDGLLLSADRNPNVRGALVVKLIDQLPRAELDHLAQAIRTGTIQALFVHREDLTQVGVDKKLLAQIPIIYCGPTANATSEVAQVVLPGLTVFEKAGTFINQQFRIQKFHQAIPGPSGVLNDIEILARLTEHLAPEQNWPATIEALWAKISSTVKPCVGIDFATLPPEGQLLAASTWQDIPFIETKGLHFTPGEKSDPESRQTTKACLA